VWEDILKSLLELKSFKSNEINAAVVKMEPLQRLFYIYEIVRYRDEPEIVLMNTTFNFGTKTAWLTEWKAVLLTRLAPYFFCRSKYDKRIGVAIIVGEEQSIRVLNEVMDYFIRTIQEDCNLAWRKQEIKGTARKKEIRFRIGIYAVEVDLVCQIMNAQHKLIRKETLQHGSLIDDYNTSLDSEMERLSTRDRISSDPK
jgi:hypothetical protein